MGNRRTGAVATGSATDLKTLTGFVGFLTKNSKSKKPIKFSEIASALDSLGSQRSFAVLQEMQERGLGLDDPVTYIRAAAQRSRVTNAPSENVEQDDVGKITKRLTWLNQFGGLSKNIVNDEVIGALYCLGVPQSMAILRGLQEKGTKVADPTSYIKAAVQRANGVRVVTNSVKKEAAEDDMAEEEEDEDDMEGAYDEEEEEILNETEPWDGEQAEAEAEEEEEVNVEVGAA